MFADVQFLVSCLSEIPACIAFDIRAELELRDDTREEILWAGGRNGRFERLC